MSKVMFLKVFKFVRLPLIVIFIVALGRFVIGISGVPYTPRGNSMFSIVVTMILSSFYFGALSSSFGNFRWIETALVGFIIAEFAEILIWIFTLISLMGNLHNSYFLHWDSLNLPEGSIADYRAMIPRTVALFTAPILCIIVACVSRALFGSLAPAMVRVTDTK
ncbi:MAG: hypothetical protein SNJ67_11280 [Chloracidobacterium sp.]|uniref:Integral membrane protein n=1 Tax=Chloracidobacterium validum TaxID=2821543 RepID=A0ABX8B9J3_9BACT|nr:hypothetical protein [Chloracidobacterium validum]QUW03607.1 hypothetical protein J8C06_04000 [Chloracidobacterium validum]